MMEQVFSGGRFLIRGEKEMYGKWYENVCEGTSRNTSSMLSDVEAREERKLMAIVGICIRKKLKTANDQFRPSIFVRMQ